MRDVTETLHSIGYKGPSPVLVKDGYVVSPVRQFWPSFYQQVRTDYLMENIEPGRFVRYNDISLRSSGSAEVLSVDGKFAKVRWLQSGIKSTEHIPSLELLESQENAA
ncbi:hypothetical protein [Marinobacter salsuginis]|jgi:hypothetical protein|uniref:Uncharacterized protein n=2 Tax=Marinobacter TaxID=2742 RepID=A0A5M3Q1U3_9GAMM|nr:hypothetical protein [Marinobacter salsuginis]GBO89188.1 hypothetical protein MSSD14B_28560 [Marinobacter salsuginis]HAC27027.1 hypothetical protein [Marinobacter nauticus]